MMMKEKVGEVFSIAMDNPAIPGCTISKAVHDGANDIICFSLARNTDISAEIYPYHKLIIMAEGVIEIYGADGFRRNLHTSESIITLTDTPMGIRTAEGAVYTEVSIRRSDIMNEAIKAGEVFRLAEIVPYPGCRHIEGEYGTVKDFSAIIEQAKTCAPPQEIETGSIIGGFAHEQVFALADKVVEAIKSGAIRKFVVMAGCDGRMKSREYYKEFAEKLPRDVVILTAGCAKYKYNKLALGDIGGIPRVLDAGQCNDSYSLALIALKLKEVFGLDDVNDLPIAFNIAWYEQKAVIVLLALLYLGVKNIHLGPTLPAFLSPNVAKVLVENFGIAGIGTVDEDLKLLVGETA